MDWHLFTASAQGTAHRSGGLPNQDAVGARGDAGLGAMPLAVAVADGHGDPRHFRSGRGARLAVDVACELAFDASTGIAGASTAPTVREELTGRLVPGIVHGWRAAVAEDLGHHPFTAEELRYRHPGDEAVVAYGSTLLLAVLAGRWLQLAQIGDGDILLVGGGGRVAAPVPSDPSLHGRFTTSLCQEDALARFRVAVLDAKEGATEILFLATDGFGNAQAAEPWQPGVGADLLTFVRERGVEWMGLQLPAWAERCASAEGSGDDTTLALLVRSVPPVAP
jgi:serine/threonine protein phosphatase PrpC